ncbi:type II secretion system F family protein [Qaidamihabitans albus]|uniref:type II secretion system F family protein n=1 Tax=Qaidamihabitans albus TaxID=2795733 RepID=UPI0018F2098A|nr:type II secretion system F family protein [Qaidamihabitans albus]
MTGQSIAAALSATALLVLPPPRATRLARMWPGTARSRWAPVLLRVRSRRRPLLFRLRRPAGGDALRMAAAGDLLAACLKAGLPVPTAVRAVAGSAPQEAADALRATAELLALGAEPAEAWAPTRRCPATAELARAACRTGRSGTALASVASALAERARAATGDEAEARAQRAGVLITGPLGLCFLPAFLCLGVIPVVIGLARQLTITT